MKKPEIIAIAAISEENRALGYEGNLVYQIPGDLKRFKELTSGFPVIMGRKTWESIPEKFRPLPQRTNIVLTSNNSYKANGAIVVTSPEEALNKSQEFEKVFIIGGAQIYSLFLPKTDSLYLTIVKEEREADTFFPEFGKEFELEKKEDFLDLKPPHSFQIFKRKKPL